MNKILYVALMALGLYIIPQTVTLFAGQHSFYTGSCDTCHSDVLSQMSGYVYEKHRDAAANKNYTTYLALGGKAYNGSTITDYKDTIWTWDSASSKWQNSSNPDDKRLVNLDRDNNGISGDEICMLCHNATLAGLETHAAVVKVCDDDRCHGNRNYSYNSPLFFNKTTPNTTAAGYNLSRADIHKLFYLDASNQSSGYAAITGFGTMGNENGSSGFISKGYWTCEGCHTETVINITIIQAPVYNHSELAPKQRYS